MGGTRRPCRSCAKPSRHSPREPTDPNYGYALYNLGNALRLSGHPDEAIPILERRLEIPDQQSTVAAELARARAEAATG